MPNIILGASTRSNLLSLQGTQSSINLTQGRLSTGLKVASAIDNAVSFFQAQALNNRAADFTDRKDGIDQGISTLKAANNGVEAIDKIVKQLKGIVSSAKTATTTEQADLTNQFQELLGQINELAGDASYQGLNLINSTASKLSVDFSTSSTATFTVEGRNLNVSGLFTNGGDALTGFNGGLSTFLGTGGAAEFSAVGTTVSAFDDAITLLDTGISKLRGAAKSLGANVTFLQTRLDFTKQYVNNLSEGADKLTLADINEEGANLVSLQTRQQLGIQALAFAGQSEQAVLRLFS
ncbi:flagellin [Desertibaculum subflavum]|uniref:flagellin n=1 Tax=Desertibaculum subflavum TaxID=2268458 RepID=UPI000E675AD7